MKDDEDDGFSFCLVRAAENVALKSCSVVFPLSYWTLSQEPGGISGPLKALHSQIEHACHSVHTEVVSTCVARMSGQHGEDM